MYFGWRAALLTWAFTAIAAYGAEPVLLASSSSGWIDAYRLDTLEPVARLRVKPMLEGVAADAAGERMFLRFPHPQAPEVCCALAALDERSLRLLIIQWPAMGTTLAGNRVFTQRADSGIEVLDARTLVHLRSMQAPGVYELAPSPDGRWLFGTMLAPMAGLDVFDLARGMMVRHMGVEGAQWLRGVWTGSQFALLAPGVEGALRLWMLGEDAERLGQPRILAAAGAKCADAEYDIATAGSRLAVYSGVSECSGYWLTDPASNAAPTRLAAGLHLSRLIGSSDGKWLYGVEMPDPPAREPRLVKLDAASGDVRTSRTLTPDSWQLTLGGIPAEWLGRMDLAAFP